ncbi:MAG: glycine/D-amino acid oxidase-like deaminating enzyme [Paracoccaceae bacterium]|jgi:glycine/D-amino acid oxidase-like deaminating enzyme
MAKRQYGAPDAKKYDVVIVGGAVVGSSVAYWLTQNPDFTGSILVIERDSTYEFSSTALSTSAIRQQFSKPINVKISQFGMEVILGFQDRMQPFYSGEIAPELGFKEHGYLYCIPPGGEDAAKERVEMQRENSAHTIYMDPGQIKERFPWLNVDDLGGASWGAAKEGWFDSVGLMNGFRRGARSSGAVYVENEVVDLVMDGPRVAAVVLQTGEQIGCGTLVNAAGPRATTLAHMAGLNIPVEPRKRYSFVFACATPVQGKMPNVIDPDGTFVRPEHKLFLAGNTPLDDGPAEVDDFSMDHSEFEDRIWPTLYNRIPQFEAIKVQQFWTGHYAYNTLDHNAIVGFHPEISNFMFANGFSGHGLQQSPAVGRGVSELIVHGSYQTLDLTPLCYERIDRNEPFLEAAII